MANNKEKALRQHLLKLLEGKGAHVDFETAVKKASVAVRGKRPKGAAHSPWEILEHMRIAQWDILEFSRDAKHASPEWPAGYWPKSAAPPTKTAWNQASAPSEPITPPCARWWLTNPPTSTPPSPTATAKPSSAKRC